MKNDPIKNTSEFIIKTICNKWLNLEDYIK